MTEEEMDDFRIHCSRCANCRPYLLPPEEVGCFCEELGIEIAAHETVGACSYNIDKEEEGEGHDA